MASNLLYDFVEFWNNWHQEWYKLISDNKIRKLNRLHTDEISNNKQGKKINDILTKDISETSVLKLPLIREKFKIDSIELYSAEIIPEPYWGFIDINNKLSSIFVNINPFLKAGSSTKHFEEIYKMGYTAYSDHLANNKTIENATTLWHRQKRGVWYYNLHNLEIPKKNKNNVDYDKINIDQLLSCDIVPWHTPKKNDLSRYLKQNYVIEFIATFQIDKIADLALNKINENSFLINKVIVRSSVFIDYINSHELIRDKFDENIEYYVIQNTHNIAKKFSSYLTIVTHKINRTRFYIFSDGVSMELPDVNYMIHKLKQDNWIVCTLRDFIKNDKHSPNSVQES
jgi:hypothetical protein